MEMRGFDMGPPKQPFSSKDKSQFNAIKLRLHEFFDPLSKV
jgi:hypothetical protein